ncbi:hypothetical protein BJV78DRAFT_1258845 [Lactifluus subvellereus]|nr:hypothetical protein BJV78DRAFT_1258845 [Lactifluus subvellereus]
MRSSERFTMSTPSPLLPFYDDDDETHTAHKPCMNPTSPSLRRPGRAFTSYLYSTTAAVSKPLYSRR